MATSASSLRSGMGCMQHMHSTWLVVVEQVKGGGVGWEGEEGRGVQVST